MFCVEKKKKEMALSKNIVYSKTSLGLHTGVICRLKRSGVSKRKMLSVVNIKATCVHSDHSALFSVLLAFF